MKTALQTAGILFVIAALLAPLIVLAKDEKTPKAAKPERRYERDGNRIVEKIKDKSASKGTNTVYRNGRTFPLMFSRLNKPKENCRAVSPNSR